MACIHGINMIARIVFIVVFCLFFFYTCYKNTGTDELNMRGFRSYPDIVQEKVRKDSKLSKIAPKENPSVSTILISNFIIFTLLFSLVGVLGHRVMNFKSYLDCFIYFLILGEVVGLFDLLVIDLLWWRNTSRIRFSILKDKSYYQDPKKHVDSFLRGIPLFALVALVVAFIVRLF